MGAYGCRTLRQNQGHPQQPMFSLLARSTPCANLKVGLPAKGTHPWPACSSYRQEEVFGDHSHASTMQKTRMELCEERW